VIGALPALERLDVRWNPLGDAAAWMAPLEQRGCTIWR